MNTEDEKKIPNDLLSMCPGTLAELLSCERCHKVASKWRKDRKYEWAAVLYCGCGKDWVVCCSCANTSIRLSTVTQVTKHNKIQIHSSARKKTSQNSEHVLEALSKRRRSLGLDAAYLDTTTWCSETETSIWLETRNSPKKYQKEDSLVGGSGVVSKFVRVLNPSSSSVRDFGNANSNTYFNADVNGTGVADVVALCQFGMTNVGDQVHPADVQFTTDLANFVHGLSINQRGDLAILLEGTVKKIRRDSQGDRLWKTSIPTTPGAMRKMFWDGKFSFLNNIPYPTVTTVGDHAYTSLRECIRNRLAFGFPLEKVEHGHSVDDNANVTTLMQSAFCQRLVTKCEATYQEPVLLLFLKEWQDGYDPNSFSKSNRGSAWVKTITISEPHEHRNDVEVSGIWSFQC